MVESKDDPGRTLDNILESERVAVEVLLALSEHTVEVRTNPTTSSSTQYENKGIQVTSGDLLSSFTSKIQSDGHLNSLTGLSSFDLLNEICNLVTKFYPSPRCRKLTVMDRIVLVFVISLYTNIIIFLPVYDIYTD